MAFDLFEVLALLCFLSATPTWPGAVAGTESSFASVTGNFETRIILSRLLVALLVVVLELLFDGLSIFFVVLSFEDARFKEILKLQQL